MRSSDRRAPPPARQIKLRPWADIRMDHGGRADAAGVTMAGAAGVGAVAIGRGRAQEQFSRTTEPRKGDAAVKTGLGVWIRQH